MKKSKFSEEQIIGILREGEGDTPGGPYVPNTTSGRGRFTNGVPNTAA
jgi:hypothetical protein